MDGRQKIRRNRISADPDAPRPSPPPPPEISQKCRFISNSRPDPLKNHSYHPSIQ